MLKLPEGYTLEQAFNDIMYLAKRLEDTENIVEGLFEVVTKNILQDETDVERAAWRLFLKYHKVNPVDKKVRQFTNRAMQQTREEMKNFEEYIIGKLAEKKVKKVTKGAMDI